MADEDVVDSAYDPVYIPYRNPEPPYSPKTCTIESKDSGYCDDDYDDTTLNQVMVDQDVVDLAYDSVYVPSQNPKPPYFPKRYTIEARDSGFDDDTAMTQDGEGLYEAVTLASVHGQTFQTNEKTALKSTRKPPYESKKKNPGVCSDLFPSFPSTIEHGRFDVSDLGGMFVLNPMGIILLIPQTAVDRNMSFDIFKRSVHEENHSMLSKFRNSHLLSSVIELNPHRLKFNEEITVKIPIDKPPFPMSSVKLLYSPTKGKNQSKWVSVPSEDKEQDDGAVESWCVVGKYCYVQMNHFCKVAVIGKKHNDDENGHDEVDEAVSESNDGGNAAEEYQEIDPMDSNGVGSSLLGSLQQENHTNPSSSYRGTELTAELCIENVNGKMLELAVKLNRKSYLVSADREKKINVVHSQDIIYDEGPFKVELILHNQTYKLRTGAPSHYVIPEKKMKHSSPPTVCFSLERGGQWSMDMKDDPMCRLSVRFNEGAYKSGLCSRLFSCFVQKSYNIPSILRMDTPLEDLDALGKKDSSDPSSNRYGKDPTATAPNIIDDYSEVILQKEDDQPKINELKYTNHVIIQDQRENPISTTSMPENLVYENQPTRKNKEMMHSQRHDGRSRTNGMIESESVKAKDENVDWQKLDPSIYMNVVEIHGRNMPGAKEKSSNDESVESSGSDSSTYMNVHLQDNNGGNVYHVNHLYVNMMNVTTTKSYLKDEEIHVRPSETKEEPQFPQQLTVEFQRFLNSELPSLLQESVLQNLKTQVPCHNLSTKSLISMCMADIDFDIVRHICQALGKEGKKYSKLIWEVRKEMLRQKAPHIADIINVREVATLMVTKELLTMEEKQILHTKLIPVEKALFIIHDVVLKLSSYKFKQFVKILNETDQSHIALMLEFLVSQS